MKLENLNTEENPQYVVLKIEDMFPIDHPGVEE